MERRLLARCNIAKFETEYQRIESQFRDSHRPKPDFTIKDITWIRKETCFWNPFQNTLALKSTIFLLLKTWLDDGNLYIYACKPEGDYPRS